MAKTTLALDVPDGFEAFVLVRPKRLPLKVKSAKRVIDTTGEAVEETPARPALRLAASNGVRK
jgi:hypothetical protein